jgi:hypothetical protein
MTDRNKCSSNREMSQDGARACPAIREKTAIAVLLREICVRSSGQANGPDNGMEQKILRELMLIAALRGGGDINETIYQSRPDRHGTCSLGDGGIRDAARSRKRDCRRRQRRRRAGERRTRPRPRSYGPRRPRPSLWMGPRTRSSSRLGTRSSSSPSLIPPQENTSGDLLRGSALPRFFPIKVPRCLGSWDTCSQSSLRWAAILLH